MGFVTVDGPLFGKMVAAGAGNLKINKNIVNDLNVFPIPDGDTGDNMYSTIASGVRKASGVESETIGHFSGSVAEGMLRGAKGNSGVILSRIFAGMAKILEGMDKTDIAGFGEALSGGVKEAYSAVQVPVEGTILTVLKEGVSYANSRIDKSSDLLSYFCDFVDEMRASLERTPEQLNVLKEAGVVDSGGAGLVFIAEGMKMAVEGKELPGEAGDIANEGGTQDIDFSRFDENTKLEFGYCTELLIRLQSFKVDLDTFDVSVITDYLNSHGESVVVFRDGSIVKLHVHTENPGDILNFCRKYGEFLTVKIENMTLQHKNTPDTFAGRTEDTLMQRRKVRKKYGIVTCAQGKGIVQLFSDIGADFVVEGGQSMNPSVEDFTGAFENVNADTIFVFPNNGNVILTVKQASEIYTGGNIVTVPTKTVGEGYAAISMIDFSSEDTEQITAEMNDIISGVATGMVSKASRQSDMDGIEIHEGEYIGFDKDSIYCAGDCVCDCTKELAGKLEAGDYDVMLLISGKDSDEQNTKKIHDELSETYPDTEVISIDGGQNIYEYIIVLE